MSEALLPAGAPSAVADRGGELVLAAGDRRRGGGGGCEVFGVLRRSGWRSAGTDPPLSRAASSTGAGNCTVGRAAYFLATYFLATFFLRSAQ